MTAQTAQYTPAPTRTPAEIEAWLRSKYVVKADQRHRDLGLGYVTAEIKDLALEISMLGVPA